MATTVVVVRPDDGNAVVLELTSCNLTADDVGPIYSCRHGPSTNFEVGACEVYVSESRRDRTDACGSRSVRRIPAGDRIGVLARVYIA